MVYAIAAYTITVGTLALYGIMIRYRQRVATATLARAAGSPPLDSRRGFNVGAALLAPFWMWAHGMRGPGAVLFVLSLGIVPLVQLEMWLPLLALVAVPVAAGAALGFTGNRIAGEHRGVEDAAVLAASQLPWALTGIVLDVIVVPWICFLFVC